MFASVQDDGGPTCVGILQSGVVGGHDPCTVVVARQVGGAGGAFVSMHLEGFDMSVLAVSE